MRERPSEAEQSGRQVGPRGVRAAHNHSQTVECGCVQVEFVGHGVERTAFAAMGPEHGFDVEGRRAETAGYIHDGATVVLGRPGGNLAEIPTDGAGEAAGVGIEVLVDTNVDEGRAIGQANKARELERCSGGGWRHGVRSILRSVGRDTWAEASRGDRGITL